MDLNGIEMSIVKSSAPVGSAMEGRPMKTLSAKVESVDWVDFKGANVKNVSMSIVKYVNNTHPFIDKEETYGNIDVVSFPETPNQLLRWLLVMQEMSDSIPSTRFGHMKDSELNIFIRSFQFRTFPDACAENNIHRKNVVLNFVDLGVNIEGKAFEAMKNFRVQSAQFFMTSDMLLEELSNVSRAEIFPNPENLNAAGASFSHEFFGTQWSLPDMLVNFQLGGPLFQLSDFKCARVDVDCFMEKHDFDSGKKIESLSVRRDAISTKTERAKTTKKVH